LTTLFTLQLLRATGVDRTDTAIKQAVARLEASLRWNDNDGCWNLRPAETGSLRAKWSRVIDGGVLALGASLGQAYLATDIRQESTRGRF
jgi:hypothetical protein